jgi:hypothetical protein
MVLRAGQKSPAPHPIRVALPVGQKVPAGQAVFTLLLAGQT